MKRIFILFNVTMLMLLMSCSDKATNDLALEEHSTVRINLSASDGGSVDGAFVFLQKNDSSAINYSQIASSDSVTFSGVIYGSYTLTVTHSEYNTYTNDNISIYSETHTQSVLLTATLPPIEVSIVTINLSPSDGGSVNGALLFLENNSNPSISYGLFASSNTVTFSDVIYGSYTLTVTHTGYNTYTDTNIFIGLKTLALSVLLTATIPPIEVSTVTIFLAHNYYAYQTNFLLDVRIVNMNGDPSMIYIGTTGVNSLTFLAIQYGSYEMTVTNPFLTTYTTHINIDSPLISRYVSLTVPGSAGGYIFYDKGYISDGWQYLEAADYLYEFEATWGASGYYMGGTFEAIGSGKQNTLFIVDWLDTQGETGKAAQLCNAMNGNGEWFLPSREELNLMHQNLCNRGVGDFGASDGTNRWHYWSSSENGTHYARGQDFSTGFMNFLYNKNGSQRVRAVRAF